MFLKYVDVRIALALMTIASTNSPITDSPQDVEDRVLKVIALTKRLPRESVTPESSFESLGIDSLDRLNILFDLESEFDIEINDVDAKRVENIPQMVAGVLVLVEARHAAPDNPPRIASSDPASASTASSAGLTDDQGQPLEPVTKPASSGE